MGIKWQLKSVQYANIFFKFKMYLCHSLRSFWLEAFFTPASLVGYFVAFHFIQFGKNKSPENIKEQIAWIIEFPNTFWFNFENEPIVFFSFLFAIEFWIGLFAWKLPQCSNEVTLDGCSKPKFISPKTISNMYEKTLFQAKNAYLARPNLS